MVWMERVGRCGSTTPLLMEIEEVDENKVWYHTINSKQVSFKIVFVGWQCTLNGCPSSTTIFICDGRRSPSVSFLGHLHNLISNQ